ncbi:type IX secretion system membrane protein PorP/SprF [Leptobacterium flavescens]|uniref:Type IX secretion system membrane protein PorP/SprF n=1 Tax=Leptobacterium flavescens TaxID=472055 RepID=A0A6P0UJ79_9FLAO|nr:type IX secretion system membrane protein PorP/SprF [Leptobacterium flavescens]NER13274.1 type IX secretion system membrane protein PorP/SprF [Leptobacterium flavescens]
MKKILTALLVSSVTYTLTAQELTLPTFTQYLADNPFVISPTYAGIGDHVKVRLNGLTQWVGIKDAPDTQSLAADVRIGNRSGVGALFYNDRNGNTRQYGARLSFAHHLTIDEYDDHFLSLGISYNFNQFRIDIDQFDPSIPDPNVTNNRATTNHNFDVGVLYRYKNFFFSANASNILNKDLDLFAISEPNRLRNYYFYTGYKWRKSRNSEFEIEPSIFYQLFENDGRSSTDINLKFRVYDFEDYYWAGISYRFLNDQILEPLNVGPMLGFKKRSFYFAYSYQVVLNDLIGFNSGTHLITVGVDLFQGLSNCRCTY